MTCPTRSDCPSNLRPAGDDGRCVLACAPVECRQSCVLGFERDDNGCLTCSCAGPVFGGCNERSDCVRTRADCCGCASTASVPAPYRGERGKTRRRGNAL